MAMRSAALETPSCGKTARDENFPVGSLLLPARLRPHVRAFYAFARAADDIADSPALAPADKIARLDRLAAAIGGADDGAAIETAARMRASLEETAVPPRHCLDLLDAFRQDATKRRYGDWDDLMAYCMRSAAPVGRYLLDLHGEGAALYPLSDALCNALQVLNHLQDCAADHRELDRVYIPETWLDAEGTGVEALAAARCDPALRRVLDRILDGVDDLLAAAAPLAAALASRRLAMEAAAIHAVARKLSALLRRRDPLAARVRLGRPAYASCIAEGIWKGLVR
ncbi:MAG: squalene synthase HpnC [Alphaproteobacteria bacterium]|nr:squalene synthase HpnC [Alphaproteobacteria bacterium]